ncbi:unnamed protein product, partial [Polarella glacialis]
TQERTAEATDEKVCVQCNQLRPEGKRVDDAASKWSGQYVCTECWECSRKIRRSQQKELDRRVEQATYSDYTTHTDELPSLDDTPQDWDSYHPMWRRERTDCPDWQLSQLSEGAKSRAVARNVRREARLEAAQKAPAAEEAFGKSGPLLNASCRATAAPV